MRINDSDSCHVWFFFLFRYIKLAFSVGWMKNRKETHQHKCHAHSVTHSISLCSLIWVILVYEQSFHTQTHRERYKRVCSGTVWHLAAMKSELHVSGNCPISRHNSNLFVVFLLKILLPLDCLNFSVSLL